MYESGENYLETIYRLNQENGSVRSIDIAHHLNVSKPSVSRAVNILKEEGYILVDENGFLVLTETGRTSASNIYDRHQTLTGFFETIANVDSETAEEDACRVEHIISESTYLGIKNFLKEFKGEK